MDSDTLITASTYLNNLLLARGLLRNAKSVDFAKPTRETRAQIINLVHDLLLKRDRDEESREGLAESLRSLRAESERKDAELERLQTRLAEKDRALVAAQVETRTARADLKRLQTLAKNTQTQLAKSKALVEQIKTQCLNDVRKRDAQIERLKTHIQGQQRGNKSLVVAPTISISGNSQRNQNAFNVSVHELQDPAYSLKQETNEFLTQLGQSLSEENDGLIALVKGTLHTLRGLLGAPEPVAETSGADVQPPTQDGGAPPTPTHERLALELSSLLETLTSLLTNPNFVSVEEVDIRDEEIARLRDGWEKMESRWQDVLRMMDGWRQKMERNGDAINLADLPRGLGLGANIGELTRQVSASPSRLRRPSVILEDSDCELEAPPTISKDSGVSLPCPANPPDFFDLRPPHSVKGQRLRQLSAAFQSPRRSISVLVHDQSPRRSATVLYHDQSSSRPSSAGKENTPDADIKVHRSQAASSSRLTTPQSPSTVPEEPELGLAEKLAAAAAAADIARDSPSRHSPGRKSGIQGRPRRRKSTLSPEELEGLLGAA